MKYFNLNFLKIFLYIGIIAGTLSCADSNETEISNNLPKDVQSLEYMLKSDDLTERGRMQVYVELYKAHRSSDLIIAKSYIDKLIEVAKSSGDVRYEAQGKYYEGIILQKLGSYPEAVQSNLEAVDLFQSLNDLPKKGDAINNLGIIFLNIQGYDQALIYLEKAAQIYETVEDYQYLSLAYSNMSTCFTKKAEWHMAKDYLMRSIAAAERTASSEQQAYLFNKLGNISYFEKEYDQAIENYRKALAFSEISSEQKYKTYDNLANAYMYKGDFNEASNWISKGKKLQGEITLSQKSTIESRNIEGEFYQLQGNHKRAIQVFNQAIELADKEVINEYFVNTLDLISKSQRALVSENARVDHQDIFRVEDLRKHQEELKAELADQLDFKKLQVVLDKEVEAHHREVKQAKLEAERMTVLKFAGSSIAFVMLSLIGVTLFINRKKQNYESKFQKIKALFEE